ncbi:interleukin-10 receptor subunit beta isoform X2 [Coregonus clupeaformis]|uniref:interleukin-10 receptor subunit beta isoform X2 n=1 Tax=Coregonus clupeaformis TaxID=59861 RepID=UPI001BE0BFB8|nr:interleukin-10 receptor subunit beta isoform X2 [Coregonus clupeaformis]
MQSTVFTILLVKLLCLTLHGMTAVLAELPSPSNVRITSINMGLVLEWDSPQNHTENLTYRSEYKWGNDRGSYQAVCWNTTARSCDFTSHLNKFGVYIFQVRVEREGETSHWVETEEFVMDEHTTLGPPSVTLVSSGADIEVSINDPVLRISEFKDVYNRVTYNITYWKEGQEEWAKPMKDIQLQKVVLALEPWTRYCFQVWVVTERFVKHSQPSNITCESTSKGKDRPWVVALVTFVVMAVTVALLGLAFWRCYRVVSFLRPKAKLPGHFTVYLLDPPCSSVLALQNSPQPDEVYHEVTIMPVGTETEERELPLLDGTT